MSHPSLEKIELVQDGQQFIDCVARGERPSSELTTAWQAFYGEASLLIRKVISRYHQVPHDREDCFQYVWHELIQLLPTWEYDPERGTFADWLACVTFRLARRYGELQSRWKRGTLAKISLTPESSQPTPDPTESLRRLERIHLVKTVLAKLQTELPEKTFSVFHMRWIEERTYTEISEQLGITCDQARERNHRAKRKASALLQRSDALSDS